MNYRDVLHEVRHGRIPREDVHKEETVKFRLSDDAKKQLEDFKDFMRGKGHSEEIIAEAVKTTTPELEREVVNEYCKQCAKKHEEKRKKKGSIFDEVSAPKHYVEGRNFEPKDVIRDWNLNFNLGNAVKYIARNGRKRGEDAIKDLQKAITYLQFEIEALSETSDEE